MNWYNKINLHRYVTSGSQEFVLLSPPFGVYLHWVQFRGRDGSRKGYYEICADWDSDSQSRIPNLSCPICKDFMDASIPESARMTGLYRYYFNALHCTRLTGKPDLTDLGTIWLSSAQIDKVVDLSGQLNTRWIYSNDPSRFRTVIRNADQSARSFADRVYFTFGRECKVIDDPAGVRIRFKDTSFQWNRPLRKLLTDYERVIEPKGADQMERDLQRLGCYAALDGVLGEPVGAMPFTSNANAWDAVEAAAAVRELERLEKSGVRISARAKARLLGVDIQIGGEALVLDDSEPIYDAADDARNRAARIMMLPDEE